MKGSLSKIWRAITNHFIMIYNKPCDTSLTKDVIMYRCYIFIYVIDIFIYIIDDIIYNIEYYTIVLLHKVDWLHIPASDG